MKTKMKILSTVTLVCILFIFGCFGKHIVWSPDGKWGAVTNDTGLYFTDPEGNITKNMHPQVYRAFWFADGRHLAIEEFAELKTWKQVEKTVLPEHRDKYIKYAESLSRVETKNEWDSKTNNLQEMNLLDESELWAVQLYIRDKASGDFPKYIIKSWSEHGVKFYYHFLRVGVWDGKDFTVEKTLWSSSERIWDVRASKKGRAIVFTSAYAREDDEPLSVSSLWIADRVTGKTVLLDQNTSLYPGWSADGKTLYYVRSIGESKAGNSVGTLLENEVCNAEGALLSEISAPRSLAGLVVGEFTKVRCLTDGRIIFSSIELTLPVIGKDIPDYRQLFVLDPARQATIARLIPSRTLDQIRGFNPDYFEVSPDEKMISLLDNDGRVAVLTIATGEVAMLQTEKLGTEVVVPVWRYPDELCYLGKGKGINELFKRKKYKEVFLQSPDDMNGWSEARSISKSWPDQVKQGWLEYEE